MIGFIFNTQAAAIEFQNEIKMRGEAAGKWELTEQNYADVYPYEATFFFAINECDTDLLTEQEIAQIQTITNDMYPKPIWQTKD